jgi:hypothetical protein
VSEASYVPPILLVTNPALISQQDTPAKASRQAHVWLRRRAGHAGEWAVMLDAHTGALLRRYVRREDGRVERVQ